MQDRFKFRIFINNKIQEVFYFYKSKNGVIFACTDLEDNTGFNIDGSTLMQCTGLKDKNGKLIYELDYVRYSNNKYKVEIDKFLGISLTNILNGDTIVMDDIVLFNCEVIGNEFESNTKI